MPPGISKVRDPQWRHERAKSARAVQSTPTYHLTRLADNEPQAVADAARSLADNPEKLARVRALLPALAEAIAASDAEAA